MGKKMNKNCGGEIKSNVDRGTEELTIVLKVDFHCDGCASKALKFVRSLEGVENVKCDYEANKMTVKGEVDSAMLRELLEQKMKKKVEFISPAKPKKDKENTENDAPQKNGQEKQKNNRKSNESNKDQKPKENQDGNKSKEPPVTTAVMKVHLHCLGCEEKIYKIVTKTKGYHEMKFDRSKDQFTVKGSIDMKALVESLTKQLKKNVELVPAKKESCGEKKGKGGGGCCGHGKDGGEGGGGKVGEFRMESLSGDLFENSYQLQLYPNPYGLLNRAVVPNQNLYPYHLPDPYSESYVVERFYTPQMFSDENPHACYVM